MAGPTRDQAKRIFWDDLKLLLPKWSTRAAYESDLHVILANMAEIWVLGFDKPERFEGTPWHGGVLTEFPHFKDSSWNETIAPALRDTNGWAIIEGVPEGRNHYFELCEYARTSGDVEWADYCWFTGDVRDPVEVAKEKARLDERTFRQEYEGSFESYEGRAYTYYDAESHRKAVTFQDILPLCLCCDFNLDPCIWEIGQDGRGFISLLDEIVQRRTDIWKMCAEAKLRLVGLFGREDKARKHPLRIYGDLEHGKSRSVSATATSWEIIKQEFSGWNVELRLRPHPRIIDRVNAVNSKMRNAKGQVNFRLDPKCVFAHKDFEMVDLVMLQSDKDVGDRTHASDAIGYFIAYDYPVIKPSTWVPQ